MQAHESLAHAPLENIRLQLSHVSLQRKAAQFGQSVRYKRDSCHSLLHAPTESINLDNPVSLERTSRGIRRTSNALARRSITQRTVFNHEPATCSQLEFPAPSALVHVTAGQRQGSISLAITGTVAESSMELPEPAPTINANSTKANGDSCNRDMPGPELKSRKQGMLPIWQYLFILLERTECTDTGAKEAREINRAMKLPVLGGLPQKESEALGALVSRCGGNDSSDPDGESCIHGSLLDDGTYSPAPTERVHTILAWLHELISERIQAGGVSVAAPIASNIHAALSDAMAGYEQCKKIVDTPFPFPWAQAMSVVLVFAVVTPLIVVGHTTVIWSSIWITWAAVHTHVMLNEVARDIEDPYHYDPNELPLPQMQYKLNERLLAVSHARRPIAFTDVGELTGPGNTVVLRDKITVSQFSVTITFGALQGMNVKPASQNQVPQASGPAARRSLESGTVRSFHCNSAEPAHPAAAAHAAV